MTKLILDRAFAASLNDVEAGSRSASKYTDVARLFAELLSLNPSRVGIKSLADVKNYGNRISEATGQDIDLLVLLASTGFDREAVRRAIEARALRRMPIILVSRSDSQWALDTQYLASGQAPVVPDLDVVPVDDAATPELESEVRPLAVKDLAELKGDMSEAEFEARLNSIARRFPGVMVKRVGDTKNLRNRLREALGQGPDHLLLVVCGAVAPAAKTVLRIEGQQAGSTSLYVAWHQSGVSYVDEVGSERSSTVQAERAVAEARSNYANSPTDAAMIESSEYRQLERVKLLHRFLPLDANAENLFEEHLSADQRLEYETKTLGYLRKLLAKKQRCVIVLTGNAGHGKTHMCRRLLEQGGRKGAIMSELHQNIEGRKAWEISDSLLPIRIIKDLSEIEPPERAAHILCELVAQDAAHVLICANEGRLRDVASRAVDRLGPILQALDRGLDLGETNPVDDDSIHVVNLNFQAAAAENGGFLDHVLSHFLDNQAAWNVCGKCSARADCPILENRNQLTLSPSVQRDNRYARAALIDLVRVAEESGYVLTYRETLVLVAFLVTGGLTCQKVEEFHRDGRRRPRLGGYALVDLLFDAPLSEDKSEALRILETIKRLDPGRIALRPVDEEIHREMETEGRLGAGVFGDESVQPKAKRDLEREVESYIALIRRARRYAWLTSSPVDQERLGVRRSERLGLSHHHLFRSLQGEPSATELLTILRRLVKGLHTIQGALSVDSKTSLHLVDPAFGRSGSHSAIIARSLKTKDLELWTESRWWRHQHPHSTPPILESVEWVDRRVLLVDRSERRVLLSLDLAAFEFVMSAASGIVMREFNSADRRRILTRLASHAESGRLCSSDEIRVLLERGDGTLTVERDGTILLERG